MPTPSRKEDFDTEFAPSGPSGLTLTNQAYEKIRDDIVRGELAPGEKLSFELLTGRYGLGMTPMREALQRLSASKLVETPNRRGFRVAPISRAHLTEVIALREIVEIALLKDSFQNADVQWEARIVAAYHALGRAADYKFNSGPYTSDWEMVHRDFHLALFSRARLPMLQEFHLALWDHSARYRNLAFAGKQLRPAAQDGHEQLMNAAIARNTEKACAILSEHITVATAHIMGHLFPA